MEFQAAEKEQRDEHHDEQMGQRDKHHDDDMEIQAAMLKRIQFDKEQESTDRTIERCVNFTCRIAVGISIVFGLLGAQHHLMEMGRDPCPYLEATTPSGLKRAGRWMFLDSCTTSIFFMLSLLVTYGLADKCLSWPFKLLAASIVCAANLSQIVLDTAISGGIIVAILSAMVMVKFCQFHHDRDDAQSAADLKLARRSFETFVEMIWCIQFLVCLVVVGIYVMPNAAW